MGWSASEYEGFVYLKGSTLQTTGGEALYNGPCRVTRIKVKLKDATDVKYLKIYDNLNPTAGTTAPEYCFPVQHGDGTIWGETEYDFPENPLLFENGISVAGSSSGGTAAGSNPTNMDAVLTILPGAS